jgi:membrane fusion protein (multidrug efflux system)
MSVFHSSRNDAVELLSHRQNGATERWSELTSTRFGSLALTFSGLRSSRSTSIARMRGGSLSGVFRRRALVLFAAGVTLLAGCKRGGSNAPAAAAPPPEVAVEVIAPRRVAVTNELPGRIDAIRVAQVRARVAGILQKRVFVEGADVKAGETLFEIDPAPFKANLASAQASVAKAEASLKQARAVAERFKSLIAAEAISRQDYDNAIAAAQEAEAEVQVAKAAATNAQLNLGYATVTAPISGRIGRALVTEGALVGQNETTPLATIQQIDPVYFDFAQSSTDVLRLRRALESGAVKGVAAAKVTLLLEDGSVYQHPGKLLFSDITVDPNTGMLALRAEFPNPERLLLPGMFARGRVEQAVNEDAITAPMRAITRGAGGAATVLVVGAENKVELRSLKLGSAVGDRWIVTDGLKAGERIVIEGVQKARPGGVVKPVSAAGPSDDRTSATTAAATK